MTDYAKPRDVEQFAGGLGQQALMCRTYGHGFNPFVVNVVQFEGSTEDYYEQILRCKCRVRRILLLNTRGAVVSSHYDYSRAPGYLAVGIGRVVGEGRDVLRLESVTRLLEQGGK
jgi:hypothetical protein